MLDNVLQSLKLTQFSKGVNDSLEKVVPRAAADYGQQQNIDKVSSYKSHNFNLGFLTRESLKDSY